jgi:hypothetical protein
VIDPPLTGVETGITGEKSLWHPQNIIGKGPRLMKMAKIRVFLDFMRARL